MYYFTKSHQSRYYVLLLLFSLLLGCSSEHKKEVISNEVFTQEAFKATMIPKLKKEGKVYKKYRTVLARKAIPGEKVVTITSDGIETVNIAKEGDYVVKNQTDAEEMYIMDAQKFEKRYDFIKTAEDGFSLYSPIGKIVGIELDDKLIKELRHGNEFRFIAPWGEEMVAKKGDYLVSPLEYDEVYRIARKEFFETYKLDL